MQKQIQILRPFLLAFALLMTLPTLVFSQGQGKGLDKEKANKKEAASQDKMRSQDKAKVQKGHEGHDHGPTEAQGKPDEMRPQPIDPNEQKTRGKAPGEAGPSDDKTAKDKADNKGNAYGKDKGDMSGREFGQNRAAEARSKNQAKKAETKRSVETGDSKVTEARDRIKKSKDKLEKDKKAKKVNDKQYEDRKKKIEEAEKQTDELERKIKVMKPKVEGSN